MKRFFLMFITFILISCPAFCQDTTPVDENNIKTYQENKLFGLENKENEKITKAQFQKLIRIGDKGIWLAQKKGKYGLLNSQGQWLVKPKFSSAERVFIKFVKLKNFRGWGLYDETGKNIIPNKYSSIDPLFGKMFLTKRNYLYGVVNYEGKKLLNNDFEDIYMPNPKTMRLKVKGQWFEIEKITNADIELPENVEKITINDNDFSLKQIAITTGAASGYSLVSATDYTMKIISSISPAYEETIDELMLSQGAEIVSLLAKFSWLPKFPFVYAKNYYHNIRNPYNGPLLNIKSTLKQKI